MSLARLTLTSPNNWANQIVDNYISGTSQNFTFTPNPKISFPKDTQVCLESASLTLSYGNIITGVNDTFAYRTSADGENKVITLPGGSNFGIQDINSIMQQTMLLNGDVGGTDPDWIYYATLTFQTTSGRTQCLLSNNFALDFTLSSLWQIVGLSGASVITTQGASLFPNVPAVNTVNTLFINTNIIAPTMNGSALSRTIATFPPSVPPWGLQSYQPSAYLWHKLEQNPISQMTVNLTDQTGLNILDLQNQPMTLSFIFQVNVNPIRELLDKITEFLNSKNSTKRIS